MMSDPAAAKSERVTNAIVEINEPNLQTLQRAYAGQA
jgi:hypothetical protein